MSELVVVSPEHHRHLTIETRYLPNLGYDQGSVMIAPVEIQEAQRRYPLVFRKHLETGRFFLNALLGFAAQENLHLDGEGNWLTDYVPLAVRKGPFLIAMMDADSNANTSVNTNANTNANKEQQQKAVLSLDLADPRVLNKNSDDGQPNSGNALFDESGNATAYLEDVNQVLATLHETSSDVHHLADTLMAFDLIEPLSLDITLTSGEQIKLEGAYTIAEEKLAALSGNQLAQLNHQGHLSAAFYIAGSIHNVGWLVERKETQHSAT